MVQGAAAGTSSELASAAGVHPWRRGMDGHPSGGWRRGTEGRRRRRRLCDAVVDLEADGTVDLIGA
jgi:hypothetical protein